MPVIGCLEERNVETVRTSITSIYSHFIVADENAGFMRELTIILQYRSYYIISQYTKDEVSW